MGLEKRGCEVGVNCWGVSICELLESPMTSQICSTHILDGEDWKL